MTGPDLSPTRLVDWVCSVWKSESSNSAAVWRSNRNLGTERFCGPRCQWLRALLNNAFADSVEDELRNAVEIELLQDVAAMRLYGMRTETENSGDLLVGLALRDQLEDLALAGS